MQRLVIFLILLFSISAFAESEGRLLRFPAIYDNQIVFTYAGDLYTVPAEGGVARRLTSHDGYEMFARFSPDGKQLAFTGQYDGNTEVYLMPAEGGIPKRITYTATLGRDDVADRMGPNNIVMTWKHDNKSIAFRSRMKSFNDFNGSLFTVNIDGSLPEQIPVPRGGFCSFSPDDQKMAYNRIFREFRTWKRYRGGMADDIWIYDFKTKQIENITNNKAQDIIPMWHGTEIYFLSDRDANKRMNLYVYDLTSKQTKQLTSYSDFDIKFPSMGKNAIVYEYGGYIYKFDFATQQSKKINIQLANDMVTGRDEIISVEKDVSNFEIAPDGKRALFGAHGDVFTVPEKNGIIRNLTNTSGVHERNSKWSPDGQWIAFISDKSGEDEIYVIKQDGSAEPKQITTKAETYKYQIYWSPDSKKLLWSDRKQRLRFVDIDTKNITEVDHSPVWEIRDYAWSPDSKWITYSKPEENSESKVYIFSLDTQKSYSVTEGWYSSGNPVFSSDGKYLFFASSRDFSPDFSWIESDFSYNDMNRIYLVTLAKETDSPFKPKSDEVTIAPKTDSKEEEDKKESAAAEVKVDPDGLTSRIIGLPITPSNYFSLASVGSKLYYGRRGSKDENIKLLMYDFEKLEEKDLGQVDGYEISADQKKMLVGQSRSYAIIDLPMAEVKITDKLDLSSMEITLNKKAEWNQIFNEAWRQMREFFYAPNMHGVDWKAVREKYAPLVKYVNHRNDLTYIIGEMIGELNIGHAYTGGGERPQPKRIKTGLLGAELAKDKSGYFKITKILDGQKWDKSLISPLQQIGVNVAEGDYILSVDGKSTKNMENIYESLVNKVDKQVTLELNSTPDENGKHIVTVLPIDDESKLYYYDWVQTNIKKVTEATDGKVGYIHIPDMGVGGLNEFVKQFYPQVKKKALIVDVRGNGGGFVSGMIIERLRREIAMITIARNTVPSTEPDAMIYGPMVCLADEFSASDGDIFPYRFKQYHLGKVIGKRTWGGVVGIRGSLPFVDGGSLNKPEFSRYGIEGKEWIMEGKGVEPDIYVDNDPAKEYAGDDQQLDRAIQEILTELKTKEKEIPPHPPYPVK
jgi:tricorn protease